jgi:hypothetical protein
MKFSVDHLFSHADGATLAYLARLAQQFVSLTGFFVAGLVPDLPQVAQPFDGRRGTRRCWSTTRTLEGWPHSREFGPQSRSRDSSLDVQVQSTPTVFLSPLRFRYPAQECLELRLVADAVQVRFDVQVHLVAVTNINRLLERLEGRDDV